MTENEYTGMNFYDARINYSEHLHESELESNPLLQFEVWYNDACNSGRLVEPQAMVVATVGDSGPSIRTVLCKEVTSDGFYFATNYDSRKGRDIAQNPAVSLLFPWHSLQRQVIVHGIAERARAADSDNYFNQRPEGSRISAIASQQSQPIAGREELEAAWEQAASAIKESGESPQRPENWGLYIVRPSRVEFWAGNQSRLHDRLVYEARDAAPRLDDDRAWGIQRLQP